MAILDWVCTELRAWTEIVWYNNYIFRFFQGKTPKAYPLAEQANPLPTALPQLPSSMVTSAPEMKAPSSYCPPPFQLFWSHCSHSPHKHKLLHAVIGCLRNLSVCQAAGEELIGLFLPEASCQLLQYLSPGSDHTVTLKLLSTVRLVAKASCARIGRDLALVQGIVKIAQSSINLPS